MVPHRVWDSITRRLNTHRSRLRCVPMDVTTKKSLMCDDGSPMSTAKEANASIPPKSALQSIKSILRVIVK